MSFFSRDKRTPYEKARDQSKEISSQIRREKRQLERSITQSEREIQRLKNDMRKHVLSNNQVALRTLAKSVVKVQHSKSNLYSAIANLDTIDNAVKNQLTNVKLTGIMQKSSDIASSLSALMKVEQLQGVTQQFSQELMKMGIMDEMMNEAVDAAFDNNELEEEADEEVEKVLNEVIGGQIRGLPGVAANIPAAVVIDEGDGEHDDMEKRLQALRS